MAKYFNKFKDALLVLCWLCAVVLVFTDAVGSIVEIGSAGNIKYHFFNQWNVFNSGALFFVLFAIALIVAVVCLYFSVKIVEKDKLKAVLIAIIPLVIYNIYAFLTFAL